MFSENQKFYLKRLAALHDFKNGRKAVYLQQKKEKTWAAYDLPNTRAVDASAGLLMYHGKQYKDLEGIVAEAHHPPDLRQPRIPAQTTPEILPCPCQGTGNSEDGSRDFPSLYSRRQNLSR